MRSFALFFVVVLLSVGSNSATAETPSPLGCANAVVDMVISGKPPDGRPPTKPPTGGPYPGPPQPPTSPGEAEDEAQGAATYGVGVLLDQVVFYDSFGNGTAGDANIYGQGAQAVVAQNC